MRFGLSPTLSTLGSANTSFLMFLCNYFSCLICANLRQINFSTERLRSKRSPERCLSKFVVASAVCGFEELHLRFMVRFAASKCSVRLRFKKYEPHRALAYALIFTSYSLLCQKSGKVVNDLVSTSALSRAEPNKRETIKILRNFLEFCEGSKCSEGLWGSFLNALYSVSRPSALHRL